MSDLDCTPREPELKPLAAPDQTQASPANGETGELFQYWSQPEPASRARIPHFGHLLLLAALLLFGWVVAMAGVGAALYFHLDGVKGFDQVQTNAYYLLGSEALVYIAAFAGCLLVFPLVWNKSFLAGIQWRGAVVLQLGWKLPATSMVCFALAGLDELLLPGPLNAPIDKIFRTPGAAWLMFAFGVTLAPFFEEIFFRGFLLPVLATAWDWADERRTRKHPLPLGEDGHPRWSMPAMAAASVATSIPFALLHGYQTGYSLGPFLLLVVISLVLCAVRLKTRSLASSVAVHACYNFLLFSLMLIGTEGFRHLDKM